MPTQWSTVSYMVSFELLCICDQSKSFTMIMIDHQNTFQIYSFNFMSESVGARQIHVLVNIAMLTVELLTWFSFVIFAQSNIFKKTCWFRIFHHKLEDDDLSSFLPFFSRISCSSFQTNQHQPTKNEKCWWFQETFFD